MLAKHNRLCVFPDDLKLFLYVNNCTGMQISCQIMLHLTACADVVELKKKRLSGSIGTMNNQVLMRCNQIRLNGVRVTSDSPSHYCL